MLYERRTACYANRCSAPSSRDHHRAHRAYRAGSVLLRCHRDVQLGGPMEHLSTLVPPARSSAMG